MEHRSAHGLSSQLQQLTTALESALQRSLQFHAHQLEEMQQQSLHKINPLAQHLAGLAETVRTASQEQQAFLAHSAEQLQGQTEALAGLLDQGKHLIHLQGLLHENLSVLAGTGAFDQAVSSLTAAIHLLTVRRGGVGGALPPSVGTHSTAGQASGGGVKQASRGRQPPESGSEVGRAA